MSTCLKFFFITLIFCISSGICNANDLNNKGRLSLVDRNKIEKERKKIFYYGGLIKNLSLMDSDFERKFGRESKVKNEMHLVRLVNNFINSKIKYTKDQISFGVPDRWQSLYEVFLNRRGDCEDFAIAKYFLLRELGVPASKLRITYGILKRGSKKSIAHMVLIYHPKAKGEMRLVLDNLKRKVIRRGPMPLSMRKDFRPIYSFNTEGVYNMLDVKKKFNPEGLSKYKEMMSRNQELERLIEQLSSLNLKSSEVLNQLHTIYNNCIN